jgi:hypothetical protein
MSFIHPNSNEPITIPIGVKCRVKFLGDPIKHKGYFVKMKTKDNAFFVDEKDGGMKIAKLSRSGMNGEITKIEII